MLKKLFGLDPQKTSIKTEIIAGITTFLTVAYILAVNPNILSETGMDKGALFTTTIIASAFATLLMGLYAKLPFMLGPGMGLNAFFAYTVCLTLGYSWQFALTAVLIEGLIFIVLTATNLRTKLVEILPLSIKQALGAGIGLFIAFIGLQNSGIIVDQPATLVTLGDITSGNALLGCIGLIITSVLLIRKVHGALLIGIILTSLIGIPMGITKIDHIFSMPPSIEPIFFKFEWEKIFTIDMVIVIFTFLFVDLFDTIGTLVGVSMKANMVDKDGNMPNLKKALFVDAIGTTVGSILGCSTITTFVESASGVSEGGRTGFTSFVTAVCFLLALFLSPLFLSIPSAATGPVLILVGFMMMSSVVNIRFNDYSEAIPAFICIIFMPLAYSIAEGIVLGLISYVIINLLAGKFEKLSVGMFIVCILFGCKFFL